MSEEQLTLEERLERIENARDELTNAAYEVESALREFRDAMQDADEASSEVYIEAFDAAIKRGILPGARVNVSGCIYECVGIYQHGFIFRTAEGRTLQQSIIRLAQNIDKLEVLS